MRRNGLSKRVFLKSPFLLCSPKVFRCFKSKPCQEPFGQPFLRTTPSLLLWRALRFRGVSDESGAFLFLPCFATPPTCYRSLSGPSGPKCPGSVFGVSLEPLGPGLDTPGTLSGHFSDTPEHGARRAPDKGAVDRNSHARKYDSTVRC